MLLVTTLLGKLLLTSEGLNECEIKLGKDITKIDLVVLDLEDFNIILGMDWLSTHHACIVCFHKIVTFCLKKGMECVFQGKWITIPPTFVSCVKA